MTKPIRTNSGLKPLDLGSLPAGQINAALGLALPVAPVHFSTKAQRHAQSRHPKDFALCLRHIGRIVRKPDYVGQAPGRTDGFELIGEVPSEGTIVLVAIKLTLDRHGRYIVASTYQIDRNKLDRRLRKAFVKPA